MSAEGQREELSMKLSEHLDNFAFQSETYISKLSQKQSYTLPTELEPTGREYLTPRGFSAELSFK